MINMCVFIKKVYCRLEICLFYVQIICYKIFDKICFFYIYELKLIFIRVDDKKGLFYYIVILYVIEIVLFKYNYFQL